MTKYILALVPLLVIFGAINTIELKLQNLQIVDSTTRAKFFHPFMQSICMFVGQALIGFVYLIQWLRDRKVQYIDKTGFQEKKAAPEWIVIFPSVMDLLSTLLSYTALNMVESSVWQISRGGNIVTTCLLSICFLKRVYGKGPLFGCFLAFLGITGVQVVAIAYSDSSQSTSLQNQVIGTILLVLSIIFNSMGLIAEKWIFNKYQISPLKMVFLQGVYGLIVLIPLTVAFQYIHCPWESASECVQVDGEYYMESISKYWNQVSSSTFLMLLNVGLVVSIGISVPIAVTVSKLISPVSRSLADVCRTVFIWLFGITITLTIGTDPQYPEYKDMQDTRVIVNVLKAIGFLVLIFGTMLYHDMIPIFKKKEPEDVSESLLQTQPQLQSETGLGEAKV